jgi:prepilin-type processing-associated H-X9-DG protein
MKAKCCERGQTKAFTLTELVVLISIICLVVCAVIPVLARPRQDVHSIMCLNQKRQLCVAWQMYADENAGALVPNMNGGAAMGGGGDPGYASGWLDWTSRGDNTNVNFLVNQTNAKLAPYVKGTSYLYKCPSDNYLSSVQKSLGWTQRVRSISANIAIGAGNAEAGPWDNLYRHVRKISEFRFPTPAETWVFLDEHPDSINDPGFFPPNATSWIDLPATYHEGAAAFALVDGHVEMHRWMGSLAKVSGVRFNFSSSPVPVGDPDIHWVSYHTPRVSQLSY